MGGGRSSGKRGKIRNSSSNQPAVDMDDRDRISRLPDEILLHILTFLPTKFAVSASSLSHRWNNLGISRSLPIFDFQTPHVQNWDTLSFVNFVNNLITVNNSQTISKFRLKTRDFNRNCLSSVNEWIRFVYSKSVIEVDLHMTLDGVFDESNDEFCLQILPCDSLKILKISSNFGLDMPIPDSSFGNLRIFHIEFQVTPLYRELAGELFTKLPLLEELSIRAGLFPPGREVTFNIIAPALKIFLFTTSCDFPEIHHVNVVIDAPLLEKICLVEDFIALYTFKNFLNLSVAKICVGKLVGVDDYNRNDSVAPYYNLRAKEILRAVSNAKSISLSSGVVLALAILPQIDLPIIPFLTKLELVIPNANANAYGWKLLLLMLENSPKLEVLILTKMEYQVKKEETRWYELEPVRSDVIEEFQFTPPEHLPTCLLLHLKEVEIRGVENVEEFEVLEYVVENANVMKKLTIHPVRSMYSNVGLTRDEIVAVLRFDGLQTRSSNSLL